MSKTLVLAEKPSVGRDIARVLGCGKKSNGHHENNRYIVTWAMGHLVSLAAPEKYKKEWANWEMEPLPMLPQPFKLEILKPTSKQYFLVKKLLERQDVKDIIIATDAGREGELVARWILDYSHCKKPIKRLWISSVTDKGIRTGFDNLVDGRKYNHLYFAARARAKADWIVGINGTRALTCKYNASLSMGRVQTPTVGLVAKRESEIHGFRPRNFYDLTMTIGDFKLKWQGDRFNKDKVESVHKMIRAAITGQRPVVAGYRESVKKVFSKGLYDLTELQRDANKAHGFSAKETLNIMQGLYERHKVLTYPRTDSKYLTDDIVDTLKDRIRACRSCGEKEEISYLMKHPIKANKSFVNNEKVGDHHAIIPTEMQPDYTAFSAKEQKIYNMVAKRFLSTLLPPKEVKEVRLEVELSGEKFSGKMNLEGKISQVDSAGIPGSATTKKERFKVGQAVEVKGSKIDVGSTEPPKPLTEGDLLHEMEKAGLGTVATRSDIIEKIINNQYVDNQDNRLRITKTGKQLLDLVPQKIRKSELTAKWEADLERMAKGNYHENEFMKEMVQFTKDIVKEIKGSDQVFKHDNVSSEACPECGQKLLIHKSKHGKRLVCPDRNCGYKKNLSKTTNARCPECHKKMELIGEGDKKTFVCKCGHKEKMSSFNKRREAKGNQMSKREVQKYMNKSQKKEESFNNPFANLLGDFEDK